MRRMVILQILYLIHVTCVYVKFILNKIIYKISFTCNSAAYIATFGKILGNFSPIVPPFATGVARVVSDVRDSWWRELERSNHWSSKLGV